MEPCDFIRRPYDEKSFPDLVRILTPFVKMCETLPTVTPKERRTWNNQEWNAYASLREEFIQNEADKLLRSKEGSWVMGNLFTRPEEITGVYSAKVNNPVTKWREGGSTVTGWVGGGRCSTVRAPDFPVTTISLCAPSVLELITVPGEPALEMDDRIEIHLNLGVEAHDAINEGYVLALLKQINKRRTGKEIGLVEDEFYLKREPLPSEHPYKLVKLDGAGRPVRTWDYSVK